MRGINNLYYIKCDIENLKKEIENIPEISSIQYTGMPNAKGISDKVYELVVKKERLLERLNKKKNKYLDELMRIEDILDKIDDVEVRALARMRYIQNMRWEDIGKEVNMDRTSCSKKVRKYLKNMELQLSHNSHQNDDNI